MQPAQFSDAVLKNSAFRNCDLSKASFTDVALPNARFDDVSLENAIISNSNLQALAISDCNTAGMTIDGVAVAALLACWQSRSDTPQVARPLRKGQFNPDDYVARLQAAIDQLATKTWFVRAGWRGKAELFTRSPPVVASLHIFKQHWFNETGQGIHFETFVGEREARKRAVIVTLHLLHTPVIPGTKLKRGVLAKHVVDECFDTVCAWPGYRFRAGRYGVQPFQLQLSYPDDDALSTVLVTEFARMCRALGPVVDRALLALAD